MNELVECLISGRDATYNGSSGPTRREAMMRICDAKPTNARRVELTRLIFELSKEQTELPMFVGAEGKHNA